MQELITKFGINGKILLAQAINFFILLFILHRFLYQPLLQTLRNRKQRIEEGVVFSEKAERRLSEAEGQKHAIINTAQEQSVHIIHEGEQRAKVREDELLQQANAKVEHLFTEATKAIAQEKTKMHQEFQSEASDILKTALVKVLMKKQALSNDDEQLIIETIHELHHI